MLKHWKVNHRELVALLEMGNIASASHPRLVLAFKNVLKDGDLIAFWYRFLSEGHTSIVHIRSALWTKNIWDTVADAWLEEFHGDGEQTFFKMPRPTQLKALINAIKEAEVRHPLHPISPRPTHMLVCLGVHCRTRVAGTARRRKSARK